MGSCGRRDLKGKLSLKTGSCECAVREEGGSGVGVRDVNSQSHAKVCTACCRLADSIDISMGR